MTKDYNIGDKNMKENTQEKNLVKKSEKSIFKKIKNFLGNLFSKKDKTAKDEISEERIIEPKEDNKFKENIKIIEIEERELLELQRKFHTGAIAKGDLTDAQIDALADLYDKQILAIKESIKRVEKEIEESNRKKEKKNA